MGEQKRRHETQPQTKAKSDTDRNLWVVTVLAFWVSVAITLGFRIYTGEFDLILVSITLGLMILGVWLKARYQLKQRKSQEDDGSV